MTSTVSQDGWAEVASLIRLQFEKRIKDMATMSAEDLKHFVEAAQRALLLETSANTYDKHVDLEMSRITPQDD